ncbi:MAG TPA: isoprenylcysteine carboxylmethyltransferase family protein [Nitrososphaerales archaeon]|nr:isoprenylcysteine carboxylmethyltransferase family protein [Nitrososphaerales archaeon]
MSHTEDAVGTKSDRLPALMSIPVPWVFVIGYLVGIGVGFLFPVTIGSGFWLAVTQVLGIASLTVGIVLAVWAQWIFHRQHTTTDPTKTTTSFVTWGPYRFSRNPMYLGLFLSFAGISGIFTFVWSILLLIIVVLYVNSVVIPAEERQLMYNFSEAYERYRSRVHRWI